MNFYKAIILPICWISSIAIASNDSIVLQQGKDGYDGCKDTYVGNVNPDSGMNFGDADELKIDFLSC